MAGNLITCKAYQISVNARLLPAFYHDQGSDMSLPPSNELTFVVTTNPNGASSAANKKQVRSIAALKSWPDRRKRTYAQYDQNATKPPTLSQTASKSSKEEGPESELDDGVSSELQFNPGGTSSRHKRSRALLQKKQRRNYSKHVDQNVESQQAHAGKQVTSENKLVKITSATDNNQMLELTSSRHASRSPTLITPPSTPQPSAPFGNMTEPFNCAPVLHKPWFDEILHHMMTVFAPRGWPALSISNSEGLMWEWWMTQHALADPALYYVRLLFASGDLIRLGTLRREKSYWLQDKAIQCINEALSDPQRATSDPLILAVGRIAIHESLYGDRGAANALHRPAQKRMIQLRGGMRALDFPPLVKRLMRLSDNLMALQGDTPRLLEDENESRNFSLAESVEVLEEWVPQEGRSLRRKIRISDLINDVDAK